jgi:hypothetical protein
MKDKQERKPYEKPAVVFERELEALAADCNSPWLGAGATCKGLDACAVLFS